MAPPVKPAPKTVERFVSWCEANDYAPQTVIQYRSVLRRFHQWLGDKELTDVTLADCEDFCTDTFGHLSYSSKKSGVVALKSYFGWVRRRKMIPSDPTDELPWPRKRKRKPTYYKPEQVAAILKEFDDPRHHLLTLLLVRQGQRITNTATLRWRQIDFGHAVVRYSPFKGNDGMNIPLDKDTGSKLKAWKAVSTRTGDDDYVFPGRYAGTWLDVDAYRDAVRAACKRCGVEYRPPHEFRRTLVTTLLQMGVDAKTVAQNVTGHAQVATLFEHYAGVDDDSVGDAIRRLPY